MLALQCGGSDGYSGITANPALGAAADILVRNGGTAILSETPEIYGAEHLLTRRAATREVGEKLVEPHRLVGRIHRPQSRRDEQQPLPRQQGRRAHDHPREIPRRCREGRHDHADGGRIEYAEPVTSQRLRVHGHARIRSGLRDRAGCGRRQRALLHDWPRIGLRLQADALDQARDQQRDLPPDDRRHGHQLRRHPRRRLGRGKGRRDLPTRSSMSPQASAPNPKNSVTATQSSFHGRSARRCNADVRHPQS